MQVQDRVDAWNLMFEFNIPLQQGTRRSQEREAERMLEAASARKEALGHRLTGELGAAVANLEAAVKTEQITRNRLLPQAELTFNAALAGYENGRVDFATLLDAQRQIRNARLALLRAQAGQQLRLAEIERLLGEDL
jgi:outer membrane protein TolC